MNEEAKEILKAKMSREELIQLVKLRFATKIKLIEGKLYVNQDPYPFRLQKFDIERLICGFIWEDSPQGHDYWEAIYRRFTPKERSIKIELNN